MERSISGLKTAHQQQQQMVTKTSILHNLIMPLLTEQGPQQEETIMTITLLMKMTDQDALFRLGKGSLFPYLMRQPQYPI